MRPRRGAASPVFEIWQVDGRVASIDNPVRLQILAHLERRSATLGDLVRATKKAKSTLSSLHIRPLLQAGLIGESVDPNDARVKWYSLRASRLGSSAVAPATLRQAVIGFVQGAGLLPLGPLLAILDLQQVAKLPKTYTDGLADRVGDFLRRMLASRDAIPELNALLEAERLGTVDGKGRVKAHDDALRPFLQQVVDRVLA
jgi:DNA-binding transcriptional ArsR family regulator